MHLYTGSKAGFAIRADEALSWHDIPQNIAGIAERCGFRIRPLNAHRQPRWQVWATGTELSDLINQAR